MVSNDELITIRLPRSHWRQIVNNIENMCGIGRSEIEILSSVKEDAHCGEGCTGWDCDFCMREPEPPETVAPDGNGLNGRPFEYKPYEPREDGAA